MKLPIFPAGTRAAQCWYSARDYEQIKARMEDGHKLPALYEDWLAGAEQREDQVRGNGGIPVRIPFDLAEFERFCAHFRVPLNTKSRSDFAVIKMKVDRDASSDPGSGVH
jgi:hypothetical protein